MSNNNEIDHFINDPNLLIKLCREVIDQLDTGSESAENIESQTQLREISRTINRLDKIGVPIPEALRAEKTRLAAALSNKTETSQHLILLIDELEDLVKDIKRRLGRDEKPARRKKPRSEHSNRTNQKIYRDYIIHALRKLGGRARVSDVLKEMEGKLSSKLLPGDLEVIPGGRMIVWKYFAQWERSRMRKEGIIKRNSPQGIWELADDHQ